MPHEESKGRLSKCRSWEEVCFVRGLSTEQLASQMNKLARAGWLVNDPEQENAEASFGEKTYTIKATRDWCICGMGDPSDS